MKKLSKLLVLSSSIVLITSCTLVPTKKNSSSSAGSNTESTQVTSDTSNTQQSSTSKDVSDHCEIITHGTSLPGSGASWGIADSADNKATFLKYLNDQAGFALIADYNDINKVFIQNHNNTSDKEYSHLCIGTGSNYGGKLFLRLNKQIKKVAVTFSAYFKTTSTPPYDAGAKLNIEDQEFLPEISETNPQPTKRVEYTYSTPSDIVKFSNDGPDQRVYIDSIEFYY